MSVLIPFRRALPHTISAAVFVLAISCTSGDSAPAEQPAAEAAAPAPPAQVPQGELNPELAARGEGLFQSKGCIGCHTIGGGRLTGPDLQGVTQRREAFWILSMVTNPDSMIKNDSTAHRLFAEYMTPMLNLSVTPDEAQALYEFLRSKAQ